jgi:hypothetical protein
MENKRIIEINGVKMEVDLRDAKVVENYKVGDNVKVLIKTYGDKFESHIGTIIAFDAYEQTPTIVIAYLKVDYSSVEIKFVHFNRTTNEVELTPLNNWDMPLKKQDIIDQFNKEEEKKKQELQEIQKKRRVFEEMFGKYFEKKEITS